MMYAGSHGEKCIDKHMIPSTQIVMTGYAGYEEAADLAEDNQSALRERFSEEYVERMITCDLAEADMEAVLRTCGYAMDYYRVSDGGIYSGLWEICEDLRCGMHVDLRAIPIRQETVEICNFLDLDPYKLGGKGIYLILTQNAQALMDELALDGIESACIGALTAEASKKITVGDTERYLNRPDIDHPDQSE